MATTETDTLGVGVVGCGVIGRKHLEAIDHSPLVTAVAVADLNTDAAREAAEKHGVGGVYGDADNLIADGAVDIVVLAMPVKGRAAVAKKAFAAGKHVLLEKPAAMNGDELREIIAAREEAADAAGRPVLGASCSSRHRFLASAKRAAEELAAGTLGPLRVLRARAAKPTGEPPKTPPPVWRVRKDLNAGGIMSNWGVYDLDYLLGLCGWRLRPKVALANVWPVSDRFDHQVAEGSNAETQVAALIRCEGGEVILLDRGEFIPAEAEDAWAIVGEHASLRLPLKPGKGSQLVLDRGDRETGATREVLYEGDETWDTVHFGPIHDLAEAVNEGRPPATALEHALQITTITDAIYRSAETGAAADVDL